MNRIGFAAVALAVATGAPGRAAARGGAAQATYSNAANGGEPASSEPASRPPAAPSPRLLPSLFLNLFEVVTKSSVPIHPGARLRITLEIADDTNDLGELTKRLHKRIGADHKLSIDRLEYPASHDRPAPKDRRSTFLVDYDEPAVRAVRAQVEARYGAAPSMNDIAAFVGQFIVKKDMLRAYDVASVVATRREGDCTEHAVLLAALGRAFGYATRVVDGLVLLTAGGRALALGHSWVEYRTSHGWSVADAALASSIDPVYLPLTVISDEGPGYAVDSGEARLLAVRRIVIDDAPR